MIEAWRNAALLGAFAGALAVLGQIPRLRPFFPLFLLTGAGLALYLKALDPQWAASSLGADAPWLAAGLLAAWSLHAETAWLRARAWPLVVLLAAIFGDRFVALGLAVAEPDPARRAKLVIAASGASLCGVTSGAAPLLLGWGGVEALVVGLLLAAFGFTPGGGTVERVAPGPKALWALIVPIGGAVACWLAILGGGLELVATGLEQIWLLPFPHGDLVAYAAAVLGGVIGDEGLFALYAREILARGLSLTTDEVSMALRAGLAVGGGLPLLVFTGSRLRTGLPLWLLQVVTAAAWLYFR